MVGTTHRESTIKREAYFMDFIVKVRSKITTPLMLTGAFRTMDTMNNAVPSGELDFVGLGRPFCIFPDVAKDLLSGRIADCTVPELLTGVDKIDMSGMLQTPWNMVQLARMGKGLEPDLDLDIWTVYENVTGQKRPV